MSDDLTVSRCFQCRVQLSLNTRQSLEGEWWGAVGHWGVGRQQSPRWGAGIYFLDVLAPCPNLQGQDCLQSRLLRTVCDLLESMGWSLREHVQARHDSWQQWFAIKQEWSRQKGRSPLTLKRRQGWTPTQRILSACRSLPSGLVFRRLCIRSFGV